MATNRFDFPSGRRRSWFIFAAVVAGGALLRCSTPAPPALTRPVNVLLITIDTLRADALGSYGSQNAATPWLDRLASGGMRFDRAHAQNVVTLASHANILSGRYPFVHGVRDNAGFRFPQSQDTLATILKARGYRTGAFVSAFPLDARFGLARGFDEYDDRLSSAARPAFLEQERAGSETVARARTWLGRDDGQPWLCWVHLYEPHFPYAPPEPFASRFRSQPYQGEVAAADAGVGALVGSILDAGASTRTVVVVTADHGESLGEHGEATHGILAYEATLRVPLIFYFPGMLSSSVRHDEAQHVDILPTILDLLGVPIPGSLDGRSLSHPPPTDADRPAYFEALSGTLNRGWAPIRGIVDSKNDGKGAALKYIDLPIPELYDLSADAREEHNLAAARPDEVASMKGLLAKYPDAVPHAGPEDAATTERLRSLGYVSGGSAVKGRYTADDDPKRLIGLDATLQRIVALYLDGQQAAALTEARGFAAQQPKMAVAWLHLAHLEREQGNLPRAVEALQRAHALTPDNSETAALLGGYLTQAGRAQDAASLLAPYAARPDADVEVLTTLALARTRQGSVDDALALLRRADAQDPRSAQVMLNEGTVLLMAGRRDAARGAFEQALARDAGLARAQSSLAAMAVEEGRMDEAVSRWRAAVARDPAEYAPIFAMGVAFARGGRPAQARACLQFFADEAPPARYGQQIAQARGWLAAGR